MYEPASYPIIAIGASAGGLKALQEFFTQMSEESGAALVVIQHLSPDHKSMMKNILANYTGMEILLAEENMKVLPNKVYLIPAGHNLSISDRTLHLQEQKNAEHRINMPIDLFFHSLATDIGEEAIAIVLSGTGTDGSRGIKTIKESGGLVVVQDPASGEFDGMPNSAISTHLADLVLPPGEMSARLLTYMSRPRLSLPPGSPEVKSIESLGSGGKEDQYFQQILQLLKRNYGMDFSNYKVATLYRRLEKAILTRQCSTIEKFYHVLLESAEEQTRLYHEFLIGVTSWFRDAEMYAELKEKVFALLFKQVQHQEFLRVWVAGCSTGEEAYSLAIALSEYQRTNEITQKIKIFASDTNRESIKFASDGTYRFADVEMIDEELRARYFVDLGDHMQVSDYIRSMIVFAHQNLITDPPFINMDLITCRNVLIYFKPEFQKKLLLNFEFGLRKAGFLWLGSSETLGDHQKDFEVISNKSKLFRVREGISRQVPQLTARRERTNRSPLAHFPQENIRRSLSENFYNRMLVGEYAPSCIIINPQFDFLYLSGDANKYLTIPPLTENINLMNMVEVTLGSAIRHAIRRYRNEGKPVLVPKLKVKVYDREGWVRLLIKGMKDAMSPEETYLLEFRDIDVEEPPTGEPILLEQTSEQNLNNTRIQELEKELLITQHNLQATIEELETSNEELQAANEELLASNEELQSTNEELRSVNEELYTVNSELQVTNNRLQETKDDIENLLQSTKLGTIFLDDKFCIRRFTPEVTKHFKFTSTDIGRPIVHFASELFYSGMTEDAQQVLSTGRKLEREVTHKNGQSFLMRITPYQTMAGQVEGVVLTFINISTLLEHQKQVQRSEARFRTIFNSAEDLICIIDDTGSILSINRDLNGKSAEQLLGTNLFELLEEAEATLVKRSLRECLDQNRAISYETNNHWGGQVRWFNNLISPLEDEEGFEGEPRQALLISRDLTQRRLIEEALNIERKTFQAFMSHGPMYTWIKNHRYVYTFVNEAGAQLFGRRPSELTGKTDFELFDATTAQATRDNDEQVMRNKESLVRVEAQQMKQGMNRYILWYKFPIGLENGSTLIGGIGLDVTEMKNAEHNIRALNSELETRVAQRTEALQAINEELEAFNYSISHDLRAPVRAIHSFSSVLLEEQGEALDRTGRRLLGKVIESADRMGILVDDLLNLSRIGRVVIKQEVIDLKPICENVLEELKDQFPGRIPEVSYEPMPLAMGDATLLRQILINLLSNAIKYQDRNKEQATLRIGGRVEQQHHVYFVQDNGIGFDPAKEDKLFKVFERLYTDTDIPGTGVGLATVRRVVERHGGRTWAEGVPGKGATFYFSLPKMNGTS